MSVHYSSETVEGDRVFRLVNPSINALPPALVTEEALRMWAAKDLIFP